MFIKEIILNNYRIYQGSHSLAFDQDKQKNIYIISGSNGFGKTSLLTSLIWSLYGKNMQEVDDSFKRQIVDMGGYRKYILSCLNYQAFAKGETSLSVTIHFSDVTIPGFTCNEIVITRQYITDREHEELEILIDGKPNELIQELGKEIFIHDFILPKEIAKFFFFDAEKNVALAEIKSITDRMNLSKAYSEILGIKKYEDLKAHLTDLRHRYRKSSASQGDAQKLEKLEEEIEQMHRIIEEKEEKLTEIAEEKIDLKLKSDRLQEKLIREGSGISLEQVKKMQQLHTKLQREHQSLKQEFMELIDMVPFALAGQLMLRLEKQLKIENASSDKELPADLVAKKVTTVIGELSSIKIPGVSMDKKMKASLISSISQLLQKHLVEPATNKLAKSLHRFSRDEQSHFEGIMQHLRTSFKGTLAEINRKIRNNRIEYNRLSKQLADAESKEADKLIQVYRNDKLELDNKILAIDEQIIEEHRSLSVTSHMYASKKKVMEEISKKVAIENRYLEKDARAAQLIQELDIFLTKIKNEKRSSLEHRIEQGLNDLMHKKNFITKVKVQVEHDMLDIHLFNKKTEIIKDNLSKGEQQIYATALLKALVEESNIDFPVFVDSPMQKYDVAHSKKIITGFYPVISRQVVLFPLLHKEMSESEFNLLLPHVKDTYLIDNSTEGGSFFVKLEATQLFNLKSSSIQHAY